MLGGRRARRRCAVRLLGVSYYSPWPGRGEPGHDTDEATAAADAVVLAGCWKAFGTAIALQPVSLCLARGTVTVATGANAAGKTTLLRLVAGLLEPSGGRRQAPQKGLYLATGDGGRSVQTVGQAVGFAAVMGGGDAAGAMELAGCAAWCERRVAQLSRGQRARLTLAVAVAARPAVLCLDEPAAHLDHAGRELLGGVLATLRAEESAVLVATPADADLQGEAWAGALDGRVHLRDGRMEVAG